MRKCWYPAFFSFFTMFSTLLRDQSHSLIHILFVLCRRFRLLSLKFYCLVIHISCKTLEIDCPWSKGSGERLQGHHGPLVLYIFLAQIQASHAGEIQHDGKKSISTHSEIQFQIWYDDVWHEQTTFQFSFLRNIVKIMKQEASV